MLIQEITRKSSLEFWARPRLGRLACVSTGQPYITPMYFVYAGNYLYGFTTMGQKVEWMRVNPLVCVQGDEIESPHKWSSVIVFGRYEELSNSPALESERELAWSLLQRRPMWWEPGYVTTVAHDKKRNLEPVYFRVHIDEVSGHRATLEGQEDHLP